MQTTYRIHTTDESHRDNGTAHDTYTRACWVLLEAEGYGPEDAITVESCDRATTYYYMTQAEADADEDGSYAASITAVKS